eukprot:6434707-Prymnesium_polylepis.1
MGAGGGGGTSDGPVDPSVVGMSRGRSVGQWIGRAAAHLLSAAVSVSGSRVEELGRHCRSEAVRGLMASWADIW